MCSSADDVVGSGAKVYDVRVVRRRWIRVNGVGEEVQAVEDIIVDLDDEVSGSRQSKQNLLAFGEWLDTVRVRADLDRLDGVGAHVLDRDIDGSGEVEICDRGVMIDEGPSSNVDLSNRRLVGLYRLPLVLA
jgi:hypothetical protein